MLPAAREDARPTSINPVARFVEPIIAIVCLLNLLARQLALEKHAASISVNGMAGD